MTDIKTQAEKVIKELVEKAGLKKGDLLVVGCSSSEIVGETIGKGSSLEAAQDVFAGIYPYLREKGIFLAAQCCEHLNRAIILEKEAAEKRGYEIVCVVPKPKAGGSFATTAYENFEEPVAVEEIRADAGLDIGLTLIGMHLSTLRFRSGSLLIISVRHTSPQRERGLSTSAANAPITLDLSVLCVIIGAVLFAQHSFFAR